MSKVVREDIDNLNAVLTVTLEKSDYESRFKFELSKQQKKAHMKGFRKGKTPISVLKKMYGKAVLAEVINDLLQSELTSYLSREKINILGQPLPSESQEPVNFELKELTDFTFKFDLGLAPSFELQGLSPDNVFEKMEVDITEEMADEELQAARKQQGERQFPEEDIRENDILKFSVRELEGETVKEDGLESEFSMLVSAISDESAREQLLAGKKGDTFRFDLFTLESGKDEKYVRKYFLNLHDDDEREVGRDYQVTVTEVSRIIPAELNQEFFDKLFGEDAVSSEEEARSKMREQLESYYNNRSEALLFRDIQDRLIEQNKFELPEDFLKRWMKASNENLSEEIVNREFSAFANNLHWSLIRNKLVQRFGIQVEPEEIVVALRNRVQSYFGRLSPGMEYLLDSTVNRLMEDKKQVEQAYEEVLYDKLFHVLAGEVGLQAHKLSLEEFEAEVEKARAASQAVQAGAAEEEE